MIYHIYKERERNCLLDMQTKIICCLSIWCQSYIKAVKTL